MKTCTKCGLEKPETEFWFNKRTGRHIARCIPCNSADKTAWKQANRDKVNEMNRRWQEANREKCRAAHERWKQRNPGLANERARAWYANNTERARASNRRNDAILKDKCYEAYGGYRCVCCGETRKPFLTIDHVNNDGASHRREVVGLGRGGGKKIYSWLIANEFPPGFQILCMNCNWGKARNGGICPHQEESEGSTTISKESTLK